MKIMKFAPQAALLLAIAGSVGCATAKPSAQLVAARQAYAAAEVEATRAAPSELRTARLALDDAEKKFRDNADTAEVNDRAYIAQRRAQLASAKAASYTATNERDSFNAKLQSLGAAAATELRATKTQLSAAEQQAQRIGKDLDATRTDLTSTRSKNEGLENQLDSSKNELNNSKNELSMSKSQLDAKQAQLEQERQARQEAETKLTSTLQAMKELQSVKEEARGLVITLSGQVLFASGKSELLPTAQRSLDNVAEAVKTQPDRAITVEGYTDSQGSRQTNMDLSQRRGEAVRSYLVSRGIPDGNIKAVGLGPDRPLASNGTAEGRANNRRVEIILAPAQPKNSAC